MKSSHRKPILPVFPVLFQGAIFSLTVGLGLFTRPWEAVFGPVKTGTPMSVWGFLGVFAVVTAVMITLLRFRSGVRVFSSVFMLAIFFGVAYLGLALFGEVGAILLFSSAILLHYALKRVWSFDLVLVMGLAGVSISMSSSITAISAAIILSVLSLYDIMAVYASGHMTRMAEKLVGGSANFAAIVPIGIDGLGVKLADANPERGFLRLGTGDIILPAIMALSVARMGLWPGLAVTVGVLIGLTLNLVIFFIQDKPKPMPALPAPAAGAILSYLIILAILG